MNADEIPNYIDRYAEAMRLESCMLDYLTGNLPPFWFDEDA